MNRVAKRDKFLKPIYLACALLSLIDVSPQHAQARRAADTTDYSSVQKSECIGPANAKVKAVYLPGWYEKGGNTSFIRLEKSNRDKLRKLAESSIPQYRIAVIVTDNTEHRLYRSWDRENLSVKEIASAAQAVCGQDSLSSSPKPALIGFSAGGYAARIIGCKRDEKQVLDQFSKVFVLGAPPIHNPNCNRSYMVYGNDINHVHELNYGFVADAMDYMTADSQSASLGNGQGPTVN